MLYLLISVHIFFALSAIITILLYGDRPARSVAWLFVVSVFPFVGVLLYIMFGINRKQFKFFTLNTIAKRRLYNINYQNKSTDKYKIDLENHSYKQMASLMRISSGFPIVGDNDLDLLKSGKKTFKHLLKSIEDAKEFIHLQYYLIDNGEVLKKLSNVLLKKLEEHVEVRILYDAIGSFNWKTEQIETLISKGAEVHALLPINIKNILSTINYRNHRKLAIIDGTTAFTGGVNITDRYVDEEKCELGIWEDIHMKLRGPIVDHLHRIFIKDYYFASNTLLLDNEEKYLPKQNSQGDTDLQVISGGPDLDYSSILYQYVTMVHNAKESIYIQNPYFIPNKILLEALKMASLRGVKVTLMVPEKLDNKMAEYSMQANFEEVLKADVQVCVIKDSFFHCKLMIVDSKIASIGSGNFDYRSFEHNYELNVLIYDQKISKNLAEDFIEQCENSKHLDYNVYKNRSLKSRLLQGFAKIFSPLL